MSDLANTLRKTSKDPETPELLKLLCDRLLMLGDEKIKILTSKGCKERMKSFDFSDSNEKEKDALMHLLAVFPFRIEK